MKRKPGGGDPASEWRAAREAAVLVDLSARGKIRVTGADRATFLQGLLTNDVAALTPGEAVYAVLADPRGHCLADLWVMAAEDAWLIETEPGLETTLLQSFERFRVMEDVAMERATEAYTLLALAGPAARQALASATDAGTIAGYAVRAVRRQRMGLPGVDVWVAAAGGDPVRRALLEAGEATGLRPAGWDTVEGLRIVAGIPRFGVDFGPDALPLEAGLTQAVSFRKGCYVGQEAIAKMHYRGKPRRVLVRLRPDASVAPPAPGTALFAGNEETGALTSSVRSPQDGEVRALGWVKRAHAAPQTQLALATPDGPHAQILGPAAALPETESLP